MRSETAFTSTWTGTNETTAVCWLLSVDGSQHKRFVAFVAENSEDKVVCHVYEGEGNTIGEARGLRVISASRLGDDGLSIEVGVAGGGYTQLSLEVNPAKPRTRYTWRNGQVLRLECLSEYDTSFNPHMRALCVTLRE